MKYEHSKRFLDCVSAIFGLIILSPVIAVVAVLVLMCLGRPVIFSQERVTLNGRIFLIRKFRSMRPAESPESFRDDHERLTLLGRILRSTSLDELPSLWNVLVGDMSIVGPRPLRPVYLPLYTAEQQRRHRVRGGLTGLAQVSGRNALSWDDKFDFDVSYVDRVGPRIDFKILLKTMGTVLGRGGVTKENESTTDMYGGTLRSQLVQFGPRAGSDEHQVWDVSTLQGERLGTAEIVVSDRRTAVVRFSRDLKHFNENDDELLAEVLRLLTNRARSLDVANAVCQLEECSAEIEHYEALGFTRLLASECKDSYPASDSSSEVLLGCRLWPEPGFERLQEMSL